MTFHTPKIFRLNEGINAYDPEITAEELTFLYLRNVEPRLGRLMPTRGYVTFQAFVALGTSDAFIGFAYYQLASRRFANLYAFTKTSVYWFNFNTNAFQTSAIYSGFNSSDDPYVFLPWYDALYVTKLNSPYVKLERTVATVIGGGIQGRYGIVANSHAYLAGVSDGVSTELARLRWSDLDDPESFAIDPAASEADFFDLEPDSKQITGLSYQRGSPVVYAENTIWIGSSIGFPGGFRHDPLFPGVGNIFHDAVVRVKEMDFFIGADNIYALNGLQLVPVGDKIFERFIADVVLAPSAGANNTSVKGYLDTRRNQVFWVYPSTANGKWSIVFNYKENKWSERDPQQLNAWFDAPRVALRGYDVINDDLTVINSATGLIDDPTAGYPQIIPQLVGMRNPVTTSSSTPMIGKATDAYLKLDTTAFDHVIETTDFFFDDFEKVKEVLKVNIELTGASVPPVQIKVGSRANQYTSVTWSDAVDLVYTMGTLSFFVRSPGVGRYMRFRLYWSNGTSSYVTDLRLLSLVKVESSDHVDPTK